MQKLKVAILEDNQMLLKELKSNLDSTGHVDVVAWATNSKELIEKANETKPEALILDIDLSGDSMDGIDVARHLNLPVLFASGKTKDYYQGIEELNLNSNITVEHITKPISLDKLNKILPKFINEIRLKENQPFVTLDFEINKRNKIPVDSIVYLCTQKGDGAESNNKQIYFKNRKAEKLIDFSFIRRDEKGLNKQKFITIHKSYVVNADCILKYISDTHEVEVEVFVSKDKSELVRLPVSEDFRKSLRKTKG